MRKLYITLIAFIFGITSINAQLTIYPSGDLTTNEGSSSMFPSSDQLWIANWSAMQNYHQTLIEFDLSEYTGGQVVSAVLKMYQFYHAPDGSPTPSKIYAITEEWDEETWSTTTNVSHGDTEYATPEFTSELGWYEIDITNLVNDWLSGSVENNGLVIIADSQTKFAQFYSKDASDEEMKPNLLVSGFVSIEENNLFTEDILVYPNPVIDKINVSFSLKSRVEAELSIADITGRLVKTTGSKFYNAGNNIQEFNLNDAHPGIYIVKIAAKGFVKTQKIIVK